MTSKHRKFLVEGNKEMLREEVQSQLEAHLLELTGKKLAIEASNCAIFSDEFVAVQILHDKRSVVPLRELNVSRTYKDRTVDRSGVDVWSYTRPDIHFDFGKRLQRFRVSGSTQTVGCSGCGATGQIPCRTCNASGTVQCSKCRGNGRVKCSSCSGKGKTTCYSCNKGVKSNGEICPNCIGGFKACNSCASQGTVVCSTCSGSTRVTCSSCSGRTTVDCFSCSGYGSHDHYLVVGSYYSVTEKKHFLHGRPQREVNTWDIELDNQHRDNNAASLAVGFEDALFVPLQKDLDNHTRIGHDHKSVLWRTVKAIQRDYRFEFTLFGDEFSLDVDADGEWTLPEVVAQRMLVVAGSRLEFDPELSEVLGMRKLLEEQITLEIESESTSIKYSMKDALGFADSYVELKAKVDIYEEAQPSERYALIESFQEFMDFGLTKLRRDLGEVYLKKKSALIGILNTSWIALAGVILLFVNLTMGSVFFLFLMLPRRRRIRKVVGKKPSRGAGHRSIAFNYMIWPVLFALIGFWSNGALDNEYDNSSELTGEMWFDAGAKLYFEAGFATNWDLDRLQQPPRRIRSMLTEMALLKEFDSWKKSQNILPPPKWNNVPAAMQDSFIVVQTLDEYRYRFLLPQGSQYYGYDEYRMGNSGWEGWGEYRLRAANRDIGLDLDWDTYSYNLERSPDYFKRVADNGMGILREMKFEDIEAIRDDQKVRYIANSPEAYARYRMYDDAQTTYLSSVSETDAAPDVVEEEPLVEQVPQLEEQEDAAQNENEALEDVEESEMDFQPFIVEIMEGKSNVNVREFPPNGRVVTQVQGGEQFTVDSVLPASEPLYLLKRELVLGPVSGGEGIRKAANAQIENVEIRFGKVFGEIQNDDGRLVQISVLENEVAVKQDEWYHLPELDGWLFSGLAEKME